MAHMMHFTTTVHDTPIGEVLIATSDAGVVSLQPTHGRIDDDLERLSLALRAVPERDDDAAADVRQQLDEYFAGERRAFDLTLEWRLVHGFTRLALDAIREIPYGETAGYGEVAVTAGSPRAARAVGTACAITPISIVVPVHRVIRADGTIGEYGGHPETKQFLLDLERAATV